MRVLVVEDDATIAEFVARGLREAGFAVDHEADGESGLQAALRQAYDVAIVDVMLPRRDGLTLIDELRKRKVTTPVLILSARRSVDEDGDLHDADRNHLELTREFNRGVLRRERLEEVVVRPQRKPSLLR